MVLLPVYWHTYYSDGLFNFYLQHLRYIWLNLQLHMHVKTTYTFTINETLRAPCSRLAFKPRVSFCTTQ